MDKAPMGRRNSNGGRILRRRSEDGSVSRDTTSSGQSVTFHMQELSPLDQGIDVYTSKPSAVDRSERMEGSHRMSRSGELSMSRSGSMSVMSDVSGLNVSNKSGCSMTMGSRRLAEKRAAMLRSGELTIDDLDKKKAGDVKDYHDYRWGGRKDYNGSVNGREDSKKGSPKLHKIDQMKEAKARASKQHKHKRESIRAPKNADGSRKRASGWHDLWGLTLRQESLRYEQLITEDKDRELVASYCEEPFWKIIFHFKGTVLRVIIEDVLFWLTLATYTSIRIRFRMEPDTELQANYENLSANLVYVGGFLLFFLVFYVNQNHHRYFKLHQDTMVMMGCVNDVATLVKAVLPMERARRINRFMNAAHVAMYTGLSETYQQDNFFDPLEARFALLTDEELHRVVQEIDVDNSGPRAANEIITWIMCDIRDAQVNSFIDTNEAMQLRERLLDFRAMIGEVFVTTTLPIPFFYVHFLSMLTAVYLPLFAIVVAFETGEVDSSSLSLSVAEVVSILVVFLQALFVIGLRILGQQLSDPYGGDLIDLQIARYVNIILNGSNQILAAKRLCPPSVETELRLQLKMSSLGEAFEYDTDEECVNQY